MNTPHIPDDDFARDRNAVSAAYASTRDSHGGPPSAIDDAIRAAARRAVSAGPRPVERPWFMRWSKPISAAAVLVLTASVIFVAIEQDASLKVAAVKAPPETRILETPAARPAPPSAQADLAASKVTASPPGESRARQTEALSSRDQNAPAFSAARKKRDDAPPTPPEVIVAAAPMAAPSQSKSEAPVLASAAPLAPPAYAPAAPPAAAPAASVVPAPAVAPVQTAVFAAPPPAAVALQGMAKEKVADRVANARAEAETGRAAVAEAKIEKLAVTGSRIEPDQHASKPVAVTPAAPAAKAVNPTQPASAQRIAPQALSPKEPALSQAYDRLREFRAQMQWKEFDEMLADVQKRWPNVELPMDLAATKREREKAKAGDNR